MASRKLEGYVPPADRPKCGMCARPLPQKVIYQTVVDETTRRTHTDKYSGVAYETVQSMLVAVGWDDSPESFGQRGLFCSNQCAAAFGRWALREIRAGKLVKKAG